MKYAVTWSTTTLENLAQIWTEADNREAVTAAATRIDKLLEAAPMKNGESREGDM